MLFRIGHMLFSNWNLVNLGKQTTLTFIYSIQWQIFTTSNWRLWMVQDKPNRFHIYSSTHTFTYYLSPITFFKLPLSISGRWYDLSLWWGLEISIPKCLAEHNPHVAVYFYLLFGSAESKSFISPMERQS